MEAYYVTIVIPYLAPENSPDTSQFVFWTRFAYRDQGACTNETNRAGMPHFSALYCSWFVKGSWSSFKGEETAKTTQLTLITKHSFRVCQGRQD